MVKPHVRLKFETPVIAMKAEAPIKQVSGELPQLALDSATRFTRTLEDVLVDWPNKEHESGRSYLNIQDSDLAWPLHVPLFPWHKETLPTGTRILPYQEGGPSEAEPVPVLSVRSRISFVDNPASVAGGEPKGRKGATTGKAAAKSQQVQIIVELGVGQGKRCTRELQTPDLIDDEANEIKNVEMISRTIAACGVALALIHVDGGGEGGSVLPTPYARFIADADAARVSHMVEGVESFHRYIEASGEARKPTDLDEAIEQFTKAQSGASKNPIDLVRYLLLRTLLNRPGGGQNTRLCTLVSDQESGLFTRDPYREGAAWVKALAIEKCPTSTPEQIQSAWDAVKVASDAAQVAGEPGRAPGDAAGTRATGSARRDALQAESRAAAAATQKGWVQFFEGAPKSGGELIRKGIEGQLALVERTNAKDSVGAEAMAGLNLGAVVNYYLVAMLSAERSRFFAHAVALPSGVGHTRPLYTAIGPLFPDAPPYPTVEAENACERSDPGQCELLRVNTLKTLRAVEADARKKMLNHLQAALQHYEATITEECDQAVDTTLRDICSAAGYGSGSKGVAVDPSVAALHRLDLPRLLQQSSHVASATAVELCRRGEYETGESLLARYLKDPATKQTVLASLAECKSHRHIPDGLGHNHPADTLAWITRPQKAQEARALVKELKSYGAIEVAESNPEVAAYLTVAFYNGMWTSVEQLFDTDRRMAANLGRERDLLLEMSRKRPRVEPVATTTEDLKNLWDLVVPATAATAMTTTDAMLHDFTASHEKTLASRLDDARRSYMNWVDDPHRKSLEDRKNRIVLRMKALSTIGDLWSVLKRNALQELREPVEELERYAGTLVVRGSDGFRCDTSFAAVVGALRLIGFMREFPDWRQSAGWRPVSEDAVVTHLMTLVQESEARTPHATRPQSGVYTVEEQRDVTGRALIDNEEALRRRIEEKGNSCLSLLYAPQPVEGDSNLCFQRFAYNMLYDIDREQLETSEADSIRDDLRDVGRAYMRWKKYGGNLPSTIALALWWVAQEDAMYSNIDILKYLDTREAPVLGKLRGGQYIGYKTIARK